MPGVLDGFDAAYLDRAVKRAEPLVHGWWRYQVLGVSNVPPAPMLVVANHSALGVAELLCMLTGFRRLFPQREWRGLMMDLFLSFPGMADFWKKVGAIPASPENGRAALAAGYDVIVFPGGDIDTCRPFYQPRKVHFGTRRGYVRLALEMGVPVVPLATIGSHYTWLMAPGGGLLSKVTFMKRWARIERFPLPLNIVLMLVLLVLVLRGLIPVWLDVLLVLALLIPPRVRITSAFLPPIDLTEKTRHLADEEARVEEGHRLVYGALSHAVATLQHPPVARAAVSAGPASTASRSDR